MEHMWPSNGRNLFRIDTGSVLRITVDDALLQKHLNLLIIVSPVPVVLVLNIYEAIHTHSAEFGQENRYIILSAFHTSDDTACAVVVVLPRNSIYRLYQPAVTSIPPGGVVPSQPKHDTFMLPTILVPAVPCAIFLRSSTESGVMSAD